MCVVVWELLSSRLSVPSSCSVLLLLRSHNIVRRGELIINLVRISCQVHRPTKCLGCYCLPSMYVYVWVCMCTSFQVATLSTLVSFARARTDVASELPPWKIVSVLIFPTFFLLLPWILLHVNLS